MRDGTWKFATISDDANTVALQSRTIHKTLRLISMKHSSFSLIVMRKRGMKVNGHILFPLRRLLVSSFGCRTKPDKTEWFDFSIA